MKSMGLYDLIKVFLYLTCTYFNSPEIYLKFVLSSEFTIIKLQAIIIY